MNAYLGRVLYVNLSSGESREEYIPNEVYEKLLAGMGLGAYMLHKYVPVGADPLGPDNLLGFVSGLLTGTGALFAGRWLVVSKSPLTGGWGDANCGGNFAPAIKACGYDGIFVQGAAASPVYLYTDGESVELRDASDLWGMDAVETEKYLLEHSGGGRRARVACIGPGGEKRSLMAGVCNDRGRIAARSGLGTVMGAKNLKAVVLAGRGKVPVSDRETIKRLNQTCNDLIPKGKFALPSWAFPWVGRLLGMRKSGSRADGLFSMGAIRQWGTIAGNEVSVATGDAPVKNWSGAPGDYKARNVNPDRILIRQTKRYQCYVCPLGCGGICEHVGGYQESHKPEYETATSLGALLLNRDLESIFYLNEYLNRAGVDTISMGGVVAFAIECFQNGLIDETDTGGVRLSWGDSQAIVKLVQMIVERQGIGDLLADGVRAAAQRLGRDAEPSAVHVGGQEAPMHDPKLDPGQMVGYLVDPTPARHTTAGFNKYDVLRLWERVEWAPESPLSFSKEERYLPTPEHGLYIAACSMYKMVIDGAGVCTFGADMGADRFQLFEYLNAATGWEKSPEDYMEMGRRVHSLRQWFNIREGLTPTKVEVSGRLYGNPPLDKGPLKGITLDLTTLRQHYWAAIGWDQQSGYPPIESLVEVGLGERQRL